MDREKVLERAIPVFWAKGFSETTVQDLEAATGVNKSGLYSEFKNKEDIFLASLQYYLKTRGGDSLLSAQPLGWHNVEQFLGIVAELLSEKDHFFYSGHGTRSGGRSGLVLVDDVGVEALLSEDEILAMPVLRSRPLIVLSACETARGEQGSSELFDVASCFLRVGARFVIGSLWVVRSDCATAFTASFYTQMSAGVFPNRAYGEAIRELQKSRGSQTTISLVSPDHPIFWAPFLALRGE